MIAAHHIWKAAGMLVAEIHGNVSNVWVGQVRDTDTGELDGLVFSAYSRGALIALMRYHLPVSHIAFEDRFCPTDP